LESHISREPVRDAVRRVLLDRLLARELAPGERLNESRLASEFGISRTPLREALLQLASDGLVESRPGRGFFVAGMEPETARDLYVLVGELEALGLQRTGRPDEDTLASLRKLDARRARRPEDYDGANAVDLDMQWHHELLTGCPNRPLLDLLEVCRRRLYRYVYVHAADFGLVGTTGLEQHGRILDALEAGLVDEATGLLRQHWRYAADVILRRLEDADLSPVRDGARS
jgi:DNA-binding GntR family transcriptional regulator